MAMHVIGAGVGRTGTLSLRLAINRLGFGPCHHMEEVIRDVPEQVRLWTAALNGHPDWNATYKGFESAVDWPTAAFYSELVDVYPSAKFVLTHRDPEDWADSFGATIYKLVEERDKAPPVMKDFLAMCYGVVARTGFPAGLNRDALIVAFTAHNEAVKRSVPADRLLVYQVKEGWGPLSKFLGTEVPEEPFPRTNNRAEFWELVSGKP